MTIFDSTKNLFGGCVVESGALPGDPAEFTARLKYSLEVWKSEGIKVVWLSVSTEKAELIKHCIAAGFEFHHTRDDILQMTLALIPGSTIPPYATHYIGAGGVVIDEQSRLLAVSERYRQSTGRRLKLPGGAVQEGEHIAAAVVREVKEETGIDARFEYLTCLRHWQGYRYGKADIYFICRLNPLSYEIHMDSNEISECLWLPLEEFLSDENVHPFNKLIVRSAAAPRPGLSEKYISEYDKDTYELLIL